MPGTSDPTETDAAEHTLLADSEPELVECDCAAWPCEHNPDPALAGCVCIFSDSTVVGSRSCPVHSVVEQLRRLYPEDFATPEPEPEDTEDANLATPEPRRYVRPTPDPAEDERLRAEAKAEREAQEQRRREREARQQAEAAEQEERGQTILDWAIVRAGELLRDMGDVFDPANTRLRLRLTHAVRAEFGEPTYTIDPIGKKRPVSEYADIVRYAIDYATADPTRKSKPPAWWNEYAAMWDWFRSGECRLGYVDRHVLNTMFQYADAKTGECYPSVLSIARDAGLGETTVERSVARLRAAKVLELVKVGGHGVSNRYRIHILRHRNDA
ncbi:MAG: helix-turn-helix domain-containing protein [Candidatus Dormiibacterota bacterium]